MIFESETIQERYLKVGGCASANRWLSYGSMIISRFPCTFFEFPFESGMGRTLIVAEPHLPVKLIVATAHFESLYMEKTRKKQLEHTFDILKSAQGKHYQNHSIVVGDFNFNATQTPTKVTGVSASLLKNKEPEENTLLNNGFRDVMHDHV